MSQWTDDLRTVVKGYALTRNLSQRDLAKCVKRSQASISLFLAGKGIPREEILNALVELVREDHPTYGAPPVAPVVAGSERLTQTIPCLSCGEETPRYLKDRRLHFCAVCGKELGRPCPQCQELNLPKAQFCMACGAALDHAPARTKTK
jgi:transcriptional regulator with XRE-family HTH domain